MPPLSRPAAGLRAMRSGPSRAKLRPAMAAGTTAVAMIALCAGTTVGAPAATPSTAAAAPAETLLATLDSPLPPRLGDGRASRDAGRTDLTIEADAAAAEARQLAAEARRLAAEEQMRRDAAAKVTAAGTGTTVLSTRPRGGTPAENRELGRFLTLEYGWDTRQWSCVDEIFTQESGWRVTADNPTSSAYGIPQALPGSKMASAGADWETNPETQILWGLGYIAERYGTPCAAWGFKQGTGWY